MGARGAAESVSQILVAFLKARTWSQAELARHLGLSVKTTRAALLALEASGVPFEREEERPHVYWSVPRTWFPTGAALGADDLKAVSRLVARLPKSDEREVVMRALLEAVPDAPGALHAQEADVAGATLVVLEDAARDRRPVRMRYYSASRGDSDDRTVSIHRFAYKGPVRFVATCHRTGVLKWFRGDRVERARIDDEAEFRATEASELHEFLATSLDGFRGQEPVAAHACFVREPEARWVKRNLPSAAEAEPVPGGVRLTWRLAALEPLARFVVGLGEAARPESEPLRREVARLAEGALAQARRRLETSGTDG